jgi:hypothetical protein
MPSIRTTKTSSGATAVQAVKYENRKTIVLKHFGSARTPVELSALMRDCEIWLAEYTKQSSLLDTGQESRVIHLGINQCLGVRYNCMYTILRKIALKMGFGVLGNNFLIDLMIMQIVEPASKLRMIKLLNRYFGLSFILYDVTTLYFETFASDDLRKPGFSKDNKSL